MGEQVNKLFFAKENIATLNKHILEKLEAQHIDRNGKEELINILIKNMKSVYKALDTRKINNSNVNSILEQFKKHSVIEAINDITKNNILSKYQNSSTLKFARDFNSVPTNGNKFVDRPTSTKVLQPVNSSSSNSAALDSAFRPILNNNMASTFNNYESNKMKNTTSLDNLQSMRDNEVMHNKRPPTPELLKGVGTNSSRNNNKDVSKNNNKDAYINNHEDGYFGLANDTGENLFNIANMDKPLDVNEYVEDISSFEDRLSRLQNDRSNISVTSQPPSKIDFTSDTFKSNLSINDNVIPSKDLYSDNLSVSKSAKMQQQSVQQPMQVQRQPVQQSAQQPMQVQQLMQVQRQPVQQSAQQPMQVQRQSVQQSAQHPMQVQRQPVQQSAQQPMQVQRQPVQQSAQHPMQVQRQPVQQSAQQPMQVQRQSAQHPMQVQPQLQPQLQTQLQPQLQQPLVSNTDFLEIKYNELKTKEQEISQKYNELIIKENNVEQKNSELLKLINTYNYLFNSAYLHLDINNTSSSYTYQLTPINNVYGIKLNHYSLPNIQYNINEDKNNILIIKQNNIEMKIVINKGKYDIETLIDALNKKMETFKILLLTDQHIKIESTDNEQFEIVPTVLSQNVLGFTSTMIDNNEYISDNICDLRIDNKIYLYLTNLSDTVPFGILFNHGNSYSDFKFENPINLDKLEILFKDSDGYQYNFYNLPHSLSFLIHKN